MVSCQSGILADVPPLARHLKFRMTDHGRVKTGGLALIDLVDGENTVCGIGQSFVHASGRTVPGLRTFPCITGTGIEVPSTPAALWLWLRGTDRGELWHRSRRLQTGLASAFQLCESIDTFRYRSGHDLTGYEDGTENPAGDAAVQAAITMQQGAGLDGSSFAAVQAWEHDLDRFETWSRQEQDYTIGRRQQDNEEIGDAPATAHVKRTAQEDFKPAAYILRRSMPWSEARRAGLVFLAFGSSFNPFEALLNRMTGKDDGLIDALFSFTRPVTGSYFWCPPMRQGRLDLSMLGY